MNYDLTGGNPSKPMPIMDNYVRNDVGGLVIEGEGATQMNDRLDVNGSDNKIYPQERNFNRDVASTQPIGMGNYAPSTTDPDVRLGQIKYAKRAGAVSVYKDETRNTANDDLASAKAESGMAWDYNDAYKSEEAEESQGI